MHCSCKGFVARRRLVTPPVHAWHFRSQGTTGKRTNAECLRFCRVPDHGHSAKIHFAECQTKGTRQRCGTRHAKTLSSAGRQQRKALGIARLCRVPAGEHSAKTAHVPSTRVRRVTAVSFCRVLQGRHSAKTKFRRVPVGGTRQSQFRRVPSTWHSANNFYFFFIQTFLLSTQIWKVNPW